MSSFDDEKCVRSLIAPGIVSAQIRCAQAWFGILQLFQRLQIAMQIATALSTSNNTKRTSLELLTTLHGRLASRCRTHGKKMRCSDTCVSASTYEFGQEDDVDVSDGLMLIA
jgi:hypothetical protein